MTAALKVGYVPEHFLTPLLLAHKHNLFSPAIHPVPCPSGTGQMLERLKNKEIDVAIGLTEGWVAGIARGEKVRIIGSFVKSPLRWAISTGPESKYNGIRDLKGSAIGISRFGSGSYVMPFVLADENGWLENGKEPFEFKILNTFEKMIESVRDGSTAAFMWEYFTTKKHYDSGRLRHIGDIYTPWPSWMITAHESLTSANGSEADPRLTGFLKGVTQGIEYFNEHNDEAIEYIAEHLGYSKQDAGDWRKTVEHVQDASKVDSGVIQHVITILQKAGVVKGEPSVNSLVVKEAL